ncbi:MAG: hypothetical protein JWP87_6153 [Labilithrix sp.]|nr:hypothetical protein [Labilithrix sp.]
MSPRLKNLLSFALKVVVATVLITWLVRSGSLDMRALGLFFQRPQLLAGDLFVFGAGTVLGALRWRALLGLAGVRLPFLRLLQLHLTALFFNVVIPGNVGGDVVKALYVARDSAPEKRTTILLIVFIDRLMGLAGLVTMATLITVIRGPTLWANPLLRPLAGTVALLGVAVVLGPALLVVVMRRAGDRIEAWTSGTTRIAGLLGRLVAAMRLLSSKPANLFAALGFSMCLHFCAMGLFTMMTRSVGGFDVGFAEIATVFPLGILTMILPLSPSGLGVGHVAFDRLFAAIGLTGGATIFNVYLIGQIAPCLIGIFPYLALKREAAPPALDAPPTEASPQGEGPA